MKYILPFMLLPFVISGCQERDSGVITNKAPFFYEQFYLPIDQSKKVVEATKTFASQNGLKLLISRRHFREGEFSTTLINDRLNITTDNVAKDDVATVGAISRDTPNDQDKALLGRYLSTMAFRRVPEAQIDRTETGSAR